MNVKFTLEYSEQEYNRICAVTVAVDDISVFLQGTQIDLRDETSVVEKLAKNRQKPITFEHGEKLAKELKAGTACHV